MSCSTTRMASPFTARCKALGGQRCMYTFNVRDIGFAKKFNGREFYGGEAV